MWYATTVGYSALCLVLLLAGSASAAAAPAGIARVPDPPPQVDGGLDRLSSVPGWHELNEAHVTYGKEQWTGPEDLSGDVLLAWDTQYLYVAAKVTDESVAQPYHAADLWQGDHVILLLDVPRQPAGGRDQEKVIQIGMSPGDLGEKANAQGEVYQWKPVMRALDKARVGSSRTVEGYQVEAAIPWDVLGVDQPEAGLPLGVEVVLSDADQSVQPKQQTLATLLTESWQLRDPDRMLEMALAGTSGKVDPATLTSAFEPVSKLFEVASGETVSVPVEPVDDRHVKELVFRGRLDHERIAGGTTALRVRLNGQELTPERIRNRLERIEMGTMSLGAYTSRGWFVPYAPSFEPADAFSPYAVEGINLYEWRFDVTGLWESERDNTVEVIHTRRDKIPNPLVVELGVSERLSPKLSPPPLKPAPTGPLTTFEPQPTPTPDYRHRILPGGAIHVALGQQTWAIESAYATLTPGWARLSAQSADSSEWQSLEANGDSLTAQTHDFTLERTIIREEDRLVITDRLTNRSGQDLPVMLRHDVAVGEAATQIYVANLPVDSPTYFADVGPAPTTMAIYDDVSLGLVSEDDVLRAQAHTFVDAGRIGIDDRYFVLAEGATQELEFSVYPIDSPDPFAFINRIRENWGTNFTLTGSFCFSGAREPFTSYTPEQLADYIHAKSAKYVSSTIPRYKPGIYAHGTALFQASNTEAMRDLIAKIKTAAPDAMPLIYFHNFISADPADKQKYPDAIHRRPDGTHADYRTPKYPLYVPRAGTPFAKVQNELIDLRFEMGAEGIYWDEMAYSAYKYDYNDVYWDGLSAIIDRETHEIRRKINNVVLATQSWRVQATKDILDRGALVANWQPETRTMTRLHFPRFVETGSLSNLAKAQLYSPIALGDHLTERNALDAYRNMVKALNYGALYYWYFDQIVASEPTLTQHMFPSTPMRLGHGFMIAQERILTNTSGLFGWGVDSNFTAHVYDRQGDLTDEIDVPRVERDGKAYAEVRIPEGYAVALVRR